MILKEDTTERRNELVRSYLPLVTRIAQKVLRRCSQTMEVEDLVSCGVIGLLKAIDHFDRKKGVPFEAFAIYRIRGEIQDYFRQIDWMSRQSRKRIKAISSAEGMLLNETGRLPSVSEIADTIGIKKNFVIDALNSAIPTISLEEYSDNKNGSLSAADQIPDYRNISPSEMIFGEWDLIKMLGFLSRRDQKIILLRFYEGKTLAKIGKTLGLSESRVSQILKSTLTQIHKNKKIIDFLKGTR